MVIRGSSPARYPCPVAEPRVLMVVPTLGRRTTMLRQCLASIAGQAPATRIALVAPLGIGDIEALASEFEAVCVADPGSLAGAINAGVEANPGIEFVNWLGDDDLLEPGSLARTVAALDARPNAVLAYGACRYIDQDGSELWISKAGSWAPRILKWGPDLIPQPGMLVRRSAWDAVGGVDATFKFAFDLDLLLKIQPLGSFVDVNAVVSSFRWHGDSLTVGDRTTSLEESEVARRRALSPTARRCAWLWERPVRVATRMAAAELHRRAKKIQQGSG